MGVAEIAETCAEQLRAEQYNARVTGLTYCHDELMRLRVRPDRGIPIFLAGQYTVLGLGNWEPRIEGVQPEAAEADEPKLIKRAYSISSPILDNQGELLRPSSSPFLEFYISLIRFTENRQPPALTPRLFALKKGDAIVCGPHVHGNYTLQHIQRDDNVVLAATGTGEAPHNAMIAELLSTGHRGRIVSVTCVRWTKDLGYLTTHQRLEKRFDNYLYVTLTTREPDNIDPKRTTFVGKRYLQDYVTTGDLERDADITLSPDRTHVFLCGSPEMIGVPHPTHDPAKRYPKPMGMVEVLERRGFQVDRPHEPGNIHFETYW